MNFTASGSYYCSQEEMIIIKRINVIAIFLGGILLFTLGHFSTYTFEEPGPNLRGNYQAGGGAAYGPGSYQLIFHEGKLYEYSDDEYTDTGEYVEIEDKVYALSSETIEDYIVLQEDDSFYFQPEIGADKPVYHMISVSKVPTFNTTDYTSDTD